MRYHSYSGLKWLSHFEDMRAIVTSMSRVLNAGFKKNVPMVNIILPFIK